MITHLTGDNRQSREYKTEFLRDSLDTSFGITMSKTLLDQLIIEGLPVDRLSYVYPAHDKLFRRPCKIAILTNIYLDGRKREQMYIDLFKSIDKDKFIFMIMGRGWEKVLSQVDIVYEHYSSFNMDKYISILWESDYVLYVGDEDCVSQSLIDAHQVGIKTIFPDIPVNHEFGIDYAFTTQEDLNMIFYKLIENKVSDLTWENYARNHLEIWTELYEKGRK